MIIDLVKVAYIRGVYDRGTEVCIAPYGAVHEGDKVMTDHGMGTVKAVVSTLDDDGIYRIFADTYPMDKIIARVEKLSYAGGVEYDLPAE